MIHGWPDTGDLWAGQVTALTDAGYRVIVPDQRGFGSSDKPADVDAYGLFDLVGDANAVLDHFGCTTAHVVGHDWGAAVAWSVALFNPERIESLTAMSVGHPTAFSAAGIEQRRLSWYMLAFQFPGITEDWLSRHDWAELRTLLETHPGTEGVIDRLSAPGALTASLNCYRANVPPEGLLGPPTELPAVPADVMGVWSTGDCYLTERQMTASEALVDGEWRYERLEDAGHWMQLDQPGKVNALLLDWLGQH